MCLGDTTHFFKVKNNTYYINYDCWKVKLSLYKDEKFTPLTTFSILGTKKKNKWSYTITNSSKYFTSYFEACYYFAKKWVLDNQNKINIVFCSTCE